MSNYARMFRGKMRMSTCRIILITSLAWLLIDVIIIMRYTDGLNGGIFKKNAQSEVSTLKVQKNQNSQYLDIIQWHIQASMENIQVSIDNQIKLSGISRYPWKIG